jgi:hypothetical protein
MERPACTPPDEVTRFRLLSIFHVCAASYHVDCHACPSIRRQSVRLSSRRKFPRNSHN